MTEQECDYMIRFLSSQIARQRVKVNKYQVVHHIDGDPLNNDLDNLRIVDIERNLK